LDVKDNYKEAINEIWRNSDYKDIQAINRGYLVRDKPEENALTFIGINPSFSESDESTKQLDNKIFSTLLQEGNDYKQYFGSFEKISKSTKMKWTHLDLLFLRETNQKKVKELFKIPFGEKFIQAQIDISKKILENLNPKIVVVANATARDFFGKKTNNKKTHDLMGYEFKFDEKIGTDRVANKNSNLYNTPFFFTSMLSDSGQLDIGSRERLVWHINKINSEL